MTTRSSVRVWRFWLCWGEGVVFTPLLPAAQGLGQRNWSRNRLAQILAWALKLFANTPVPGAVMCFPPSLCQGKDGVLTEGTFTEDNWQQTATVDPRYQNTRQYKRWLRFWLLPLPPWRWWPWCLEGQYLGLANFSTYPEAGARLGPVKLPNFSVCGRFLQQRRATTPVK